MNKDFNRRAGELFGEDVRDMLDSGDLFAGRLMDDRSNIPPLSKLLALSEPELWVEIQRTAEKIQLYNMFASKFLAYNKNPVDYDNYTYSKGV